MTFRRPRKRAKIEKESFRISGRVLGYLFLSALFVAWHACELPLEYAAILLSFLIVGYGTAFAFPRVARKVLSGSNTPDYERVSHHVGSHYRIDPFAVEDLIRSLLLAFARLLDRASLLLSHLLSIHRLLLVPTNHRNLRALEEHTSLRLFILTSDHTLRPPPQLL